MDTMRVVAEVGTTLYRWATAHPVEAAGVLWAAQALARRMRWSPRFVLWATRAVWGRTTSRFGPALATPAALLLDAVTLPGAIARGFGWRRHCKDASHGCLDSIRIEIIDGVARELMTMRKKSQADEERCDLKRRELHDRITRHEQTDATRRENRAEALEQRLVREMNERIDARIGQERAHFTKWIDARIDQLRVASKPFGETQQANPMRPLFGDTPRLSLVTIERPEDAAESKRLGMALLALFGATDGKRPEGLAFDLHLGTDGVIRGVVEISDEVAAICHGTAYAMADAVAKVLGREPSSAILIDTKTGARIELP